MIGASNLSRLHCLSQQGAVPVLKASQWQGREGERREKASGPHLAHWRPHKDSVVCVGVKVPRAHDSAVIAPCGPLQLHANPIPSAKMAIAHMAHSLKPPKRTKAKAKARIQMK